MPRRNSPRRFRRNRAATDAPDAELTYDQVARRLVMAGKASPLILGPIRDGWHHLVSYGAPDVLNDPDFTTTNRKEIHP